MPGPQVYGRIPIFQWICREEPCPLRGGLRAGRPTISRKVRANLRGVEDAAPYKAAF